MLLTVRLFAGLRERAGASTVEVELAEGATVEDLLRALGETPVGLLSPKQVVVALNREYAEATATIAATDEIAVIPPVSGGAGEPDRLPAVRLIAVTGDPLDLGRVAAAVRDPRAGAIVCFEGVTRDVEALDYEAYEPMARERLAQIAADVVVAHGLCAAAVVHRFGRVALGEPSVIVAASAAHRGEAFSGARALIDRVKAEAPIWKVELDGEDRRRVEGLLPPTR